ncbi:MAG: Zn-ribbon domain-containing OB-fold protein [Dehalococcoidia bacterium]
MDRPIPVPTAESQPFWDACASGELHYQYCRVCERSQFPPRNQCALCGSPVEWRRSSGKGTIHSVTVVHRAPSPGFVADVPYALALVDLEEQFRIMANIVGGEPATFRIGQRVSVSFRRISDSIVLPQFQPIPAYSCAAS